MARQSITTQNAAGIGPALVGIAFIAFSAELPEKAEGILCRVFCVLSHVVLQALPDILLAGLQALTSFAVVHGWVLTGLQLLTSAGSLLHFLVAA